MSRLLLSALLIAAFASVQALAYSPSAVPNNTVLQQSNTISYPGGVWRDDFANGAGAGPLWFLPESGTCAANGRVNDGGSCVDAQGGNSFFAPNGSALDVRQFFSGTGLINYLGKVPPGGAAISGSQGALGTTFNPYTAVYPGGVGQSGLSFPSTGMDQNAAWLQGVGANKGGPLINNNAFPFGDLDSSVACSFSVGSNQPSGSTGYLTPLQFGTLQITDTIGCTFRNDSSPPFGPFPGVFTATTFAPTTALSATNVTYPFQSTQTATMQSLLRVGMWVRSDDVVPYWGEITSVGPPLTVLGWVQDGSSSYGTPAGSNLIVNDIRGLYAFLSYTASNALCTGAPCTQPTGTVATGSTAITGVSTTAGMFPGQFIGSAHLVTTVIKSVSGTTITVYGPGATGNATETLKVNAHVGNQFRGAEIDVVNLGPDAQFYIPETVTGCAATAGSNHLTGCSAIPLDVHPGLLTFPSNSTVTPSGAAVLSIDTTTSLYLAQKATNSGTVNLTFYVGPVEGGTGFDMAGTNGTTQASIISRGNLVNGFVSYGAYNSAFMLQQNGLAPMPINGFEVDCSIACPSSYTFRSGNRRTNTTNFFVDPSGNVFGSGFGAFSEVNAANGGSVMVPSGYAANFHATTNANITIGAGAFFPGLGGAAVIAYNDATATPVELALVGSQIDLDGTPQLFASTTGASTATFTNAPCPTGTRWVPVTLNGQTGTWYVPACH